VLISLISVYYAPVESDAYEYPIRITTGNSSDENNIINKSKIKPGFDENNFEVIEMIKYRIDSFI